MCAEAISPSIGHDGYLVTHHRRGARVANQPTAPVERIPEMKEMSLEQQLEFGMVWRGTEGDLWRFILFTDECCGELLGDADGNAT